MAGGIRILISRYTMIMKELHGKISVKMKEPQITALLVKYVSGFEQERFEIVAVRLFSAQELVLTVYAHDKLNQSSTLHQGRIPVKKFKIGVNSALELLELAEAFNFTVCSEEYRLEDMEVINK